MLILNGRGPNWIHGTLDNPILNLAKKTGTVLSAVEDSMCVFDQNGKVLSQDKTTQISDLMWDIITEAFKHSNENSANISPERSLKDFFLDQVITKGLSEEDRTLVLQMAEMWGGFIGDPLERQSLKNFWLEECLDGGECHIVGDQILSMEIADRLTENLFVASSHAKILHTVAEKVLKDAKVLLRTKVASIKNASSTEGHGKVYVTTDDDSTLEFDDVVVTIPLGALKRGKPNFSPALPPAINHAIQNTSYGRLEKVFITFPKAFWESPASSEPRSSQLSAQLPARFESFANFLHPTYSTEKNPESWSLELNSLSSPQIFGSHAQPTLLFGIHGDCATHITSLITALSPASSEYFEVIDDFFRPYYALLPNFDPSDSNCRPGAVLATNWQNDELAGYGSYMNFQTADRSKVGVSDFRQDEQIRVLRNGMPERGIWLAGDYTAPFVAVGTLTGAYWSGESVAMRISRRYKKVGSSTQ